MERYLSKVLLFYVIIFTPATLATQNITYRIRVKVCAETDSGTKSGLAINIYQNYASKIGTGFVWIGDMPEKLTFKPYPPHKFKANEMHEFTFGCFTIQKRMLLCPNMERIDRIVLAMSAAYDDVARFDWLQVKLTNGNKFRLELACQTYRPGLFYHFKFEENRDIGKAVK